MVARRCGKIYRNVGGHSPSLQRFATFSEEIDFRDVRIICLDKTRFFCYNNTVDIVSRLHEFLCACGEIGRHVGFRFQCESVQVQVLSGVP